RGRPGRTPSSRTVPLGAARPWRSIECCASGSKGSGWQPCCAPKLEMGHPVAVPRLLPFLIFLAVQLTLVGRMHYYLCVRFVRELHLPHPWVRVLTVAIIAAALAMPATLIAVRLLPSAAVRPAIWIAFIWMGVGFLLVAF